MSKIALVDFCNNFIRLRFCIFLEYLFIMKRMRNETVTEMMGSLWGLKTFPVQNVSPDRRFPERRFPEKLYEGILMCILCANVNVCE